MNISSRALCVQVNSLDDISTSSLQIGGSSYSLQHIVKLTTMFAEEHMRHSTSHPPPRTGGTWCHISAVCRHMASPLHPLIVYSSSTRLLTTWLQFVTPKNNLILQKCGPRIRLSWVHSMVQTKVGKRLTEAVHVGLTDCHCVRCCAIVMSENM